MEFQEVQPIPVHIPHLVHHLGRNHQQVHHLLQSGSGHNYFLEIPPHHQLVVVQPHRIEEGLVLVLGLWAHHEQLDLKENKEVIVVVQHLAHHLRHHL